MTTFQPNLTPLFPLDAVLCPRGRIPLQLFEPRYTDMVAQCLKSQTGFVVLLISEGQQVGGQCQFHQVGTYAQVVDFEQLANGLLGVTAQGQNKVSVSETERQSDGLYVGRIDQLPDERRSRVPEYFGDLVALLASLQGHPVVQALHMNIDYNDASDVGWRLTELLPFDLEHKQELLELEDPLLRLERIHDMLRYIQD